jgi:iron complex outermembrane receptor protein
MSNKSKHVIVSIMATIGGAGSGTVFSQEEPDTAGGLEEIVVTATRQEQALQEVPMSIVALTGENLKMRSIETVENLQGTIPNLSVIGDTNGATQSTNFSIRGIPRVGVYVDNVWQPYTQGLMEFGLDDIDRIEVLRGPQGTLYGRDSTGGAIRVVTKMPEDDFGGSAVLTFGSNDRRDVQASVNVPLSDTVKTRVSASLLNQDGYVHSVTLNEDLGQIDSTRVSADVLWKPTDRFYARAKYIDRESHPTDARIALWHDPLAANLVGFAYGNTDLYSLAGAPYDGAHQVAGFQGGRLGEWETAIGDAKPADLNVEQASLEMRWAVTDNIALQSWTSYVDQHNNGLVDYDNAEWEAVTVWEYRENSIFSQELQLSGSHERFNWVGGVYYWEEDNAGRDLWWGFEEFQDGRLDRNVALQSPQCQAPTELLGCAGAFGVYEFIGDQDEIVKSEEDGFAIFGEVTVNLLDKLDLTLGGRYHDQDVEESTLSFVPGVTAPKPVQIGPLVQGDPFGGSTAITDTSSFDEFTMRGVLRYTFSEKMMGYLSYSEGFNAGGAEAVEVSTGRILIPFGPEEIQSYEVGFRSDLFDGRLRLNAWLFHTDWDNIQLESPFIDPDIGVFAVTFITQNAAAAEADGLEAEVTWQAMDNLALDFNLGLLDTNYTEFKFGEDTPVNEGDTFAQAPETTYSAGIQYEADLPWGALTSRVDYRYVSGFQRYADPNFHPDAVGLTDLLGKYEAGDYGLLGARVVYRPAASDNWELAVFGTNLTDERVINGGFYGPIWELDFSTVARPREFGVSLSVDF